MKKLSGISEMALASLFTALLAVCAVITVPAPIPFTLQTFALFLIAGLLPLRSAFPCVLAYILLGAVGLPVFRASAQASGYCLDLPAVIFSDFCCLYLCKSLFLS